MASRNFFDQLSLGRHFLPSKSAIRKRAAACPTAREDIMIGEAVRLRRPSDKTLATACSPPACTATQHPLPPSVSPASPSLSPSRPLPLSLPDRHMPTDQTHGTHALVTTRNLHDLTRSGASLLTENAKVGKKSCARRGSWVERNGSRDGVTCGRSAARHARAGPRSRRAGRVQAGGLALTGSSTLTPDC